MSAGLIVAESAASFIAAVSALHFLKAHFLGYDGSPAKVTEAEVIAWATKAAGHNYFQRLLCGFDMFLNVIFGGNLDETISSRVHRWMVSKNPEFFLWRWTATWIIWLCDLVQTAHGVKANAGDMIRALNELNLARKTLGLPPIVVS